MADKTDEEKAAEVHASWSAYQSYDKIVADLDKISDNSMVISSSIIPAPIIAISPEAAAEVRASILKYCTKQKNLLKKEFKEKLK